MLLLLVFVVSHPFLFNTSHNPDLIDMLQRKVSRERFGLEITKMFKRHGENIEEEEQEEEEEEEQEERGKRSRARRRSRRKHVRVPARKRGE